MEIKTVKEWVMHAEDADRFVDRHGRIILAGDATYRFPPAGRFSNFYPLPFSSHA